MNMPMMPGQQKVSEIGSKIKKLGKRIVMQALKKFAKKIAKMLLKALMKVIIKAVVALIGYVGGPVLLIVLACVLLSSIIFSAFSFDWLTGGADTPTAAEIRARYIKAVEKTSPDEEYRPPLVIVQAIDNMRIIKNKLKPEDVNPEQVAKMLKAIITSKKFETHVSVSTTTYKTVEKKDKNGVITKETTLHSSSSTSYTEEEELITKIDKWDATLDYTYEEVSLPSTTSTSVDNRMGLTVYRTTTKTTWQRKDTAQCSESSTGVVNNTNLKVEIKSSTVPPFFRLYGPFAFEESVKSGIPASVTLAQAALESGWGRSKLASKHYNFFGIKKHDWTGKIVTLTTKEVVGGQSIIVSADFRSYVSPLEGFADHSQFLLENKRYRNALSKTNPFDFANELQRAGYATDPEYAKKLKSMINNYNLTLFDPQKGIDPTTGMEYENNALVYDSSRCGNYSFAKFEEALKYYKFTPKENETIMVMVDQNDGSENYLYFYSNHDQASNSDVDFSDSDQNVDVKEYVWPTAATRITSQFGYRKDPFTSVSKLHKGIDIAPNIKAEEYPVFATKGGIVIVSGYQEDYGYRIKIQHDNGVISHYAHMKMGSLQVNKGKYVNSGDFIGVMGNTGQRTTGRHLHFEIFVYNVVTNPNKFLKKPS